MAPSAIYYDETVSNNMKKAGAALEAVSDAIDEVNLLKAIASDKLRLTTNIAPPSPPLSSSSSSPSTETFPTITKQPSTFRDYNNAKPAVKTLYTEQHAKQTVAYNISARQNFHSASRKRPELTIWEAMEKLNSLIDQSDPDTTLSQIQHLLQSAEAIRRDGKPRWMQLTGLIHDLGKLMFYFDGAQGQWDVVGDTFPVGCAYSEKCIFPETFAANPDYGHEVYSTEYGIYKPGCGMENLIMSWGHDEYLYLVVRDQSTLPREALAMIRFHSFYPWHTEGAYREFMAPDGADEGLLSAVRAFNPYDLYSKSDEVPDVEGLKEYYLELIDEFFPTKKIKW